jgi:antitoxin component HigA of HigAB toxin-antitoxin module
MMQSNEENKYCPNKWKNKIFPYFWVMRVIKNKKTVALLKAHLKSKGIKYSWLCDKLDVSNGHLTNILQHKRSLTPELNEKINKVLGTDFKI